MPSSSVGCLAFQKVIGVGPGREISGSKTSSFLQANLPELEMFKTRKSEPKKLRHQLLDTLRMRSIVSSLGPTSQPQFHLQDFEPFIFGLPV